MDEKKILIIAGPDGAGKTAFATEFLRREADCPTFVDAEALAAGLNPFQPERAIPMAERLMVEVIDAYVKQGLSFAFETTLSELDLDAKIPLWREWGYRTKIYFLRLPDPEAAIARVRQREAEGGSSPPDEVVRRRFHTGRRNFERVYRSLVDEWSIYDNLGAAPLLAWKMGMVEGEEVDEAVHVDADDAGAQAALGRASVAARRRALEAAGSVPLWSDGEVVYESDPKLLFPAEEGDTAAC